MADTTTPAIHAVINSLALISVWDGSRAVAEDATALIIALMEERNAAVIAATTEKE